MASPVESMIRRTVTKGIMKVAKFNRDRAPAPEQPHPFLNGIHQPMDQELTWRRPVLTSACEHVDRTCHAASCSGTHSQCVEPCSDSSSPGTSQWKLALPSRMTLTAPDDDEPAVA